MSDWVSTSVVGSVLELTLNRPAKRNALTQNMYGALSAALDRVEREQCGVLNATVDGEYLLSHARSVAQRLAKKPGNALRASKQLMRRAPESRKERIAVELEAFGLALSSPEAAEAMTAFVEKRKPDFTRFE
jgi:enoyl-CoA hydratase/carnithine racemase